MSASFKLCAVVAAVVIVSVTAIERMPHIPRPSRVSSALSVHAGCPTCHRNITAVQCQDRTCGGSCSEYNFTDGGCYQGAKYTCFDSLAECMDLTMFNTTDVHSCGNNTLSSTTSVPCEFCFTVSDQNGGNITHGAIRDCKNDTLRTFHYECDAGCIHCNKTILLPLNTCVTDPWNNATITATAHHPCKRVVDFKLFAQNNCTGELQSHSAMEANTCFVFGSDMSNEMLCAGH